MNKTLPNINFGNKQSNLIVNTVSAIRQINNNNLSK